MIISSKYSLSMPITLLLVLSLIARVIAQDGGEQVLPLTVVPGRQAETQRAHERMRQRHTMRADADPVAIPFVDDFSVDHFPGNAENRAVYWTNRSAYQNYTWSENPPTIGMVSFDGTGKFGFPYDYNASNNGVASDTLESAPVLLGSSDISDSLYLSFYYQAGGLLPPPEADENDKLSLFFYDSDLDQWYNVWNGISDGPTPFQFAKVAIDEERYFTDNFKFRFINYAKQTGSFDVYNVDYIWLDQGGANTDSVSNDVAFTEKPARMLEIYSSIPWWHYNMNPGGYMRGSLSLTLRNLNDGARTLDGNFFSVYKDGVEVNSFDNPNSPAISGGGTLDYTYSIGDEPNNFIFSLDTAAVFDVYYAHGVSDFVETKSNDTARFHQKFSDYYSYDDGSAEGSFLVNTAPASLALGFDFYEPDSVWGIDIAHSPVGEETTDGSPVFISLWDESPNGGPGDLIAEKNTTVEYDYDDQDSFTTYVFDEPAYVESGRYFIGFAQTSDVLTLYMDQNTNGNQGNLYKKFQEQWEETDTQYGSVMMRPRLGSNPTSGFHNEPELKYSLYPNPAKGRVKLNFSGILARVSAFDLTGRQIWAGTLQSGGSINVASWPKGVYLLRITTKSNGSARAKMVIAR